MKALFTALVLLASAALVGCDGHSTGTSEKHPGGPGVTNPSQREPIFGTGENEFKLSVPTLATHLKQGETKQVKIGIDRGKNFDQDVTLKFEGSPDMPKGVTLEPASPAIKHGDKETMVTVKAADDATVGDFKIKVEGKPAKGKEADATLEIKVDKK
jgi:uncharacterized membrane protein